MANTLQRRSEKTMGIHVACEGTLIWRVQYHLRSSTFKELKGQVLRAKSGKVKATSKATGYLTRAEMYGARTSQRRVLGMVAAVRRVTP